MDLRDIFASHAMEGLLAGRSDVAIDSVANVAYIVADSMMTQRAYIMADIMMTQRVAPEHPEDED
jgi:hypothetical protein